MKNSKIFLLCFSILFCMGTGQRAFADPDSTKWYLGQTAVSGVTPSAQGNLQGTTTGFGTGWTPVVTLSTTPYYWYSNTLNGSIASGSWYDSIITNATAGTVCVSIYKTNSDGSGATMICSTSVTNHGGGNNYDPLSVSGVSAVSLSNQRLRVGVSASAGITMAYAVTAFGLATGDGPSINSPPVTYGPSAPTGLTVTPGTITQTGAAFTWTAGSDGASSYNLQVSTSPTFSSPVVTATINSPTTSYSTTALTAGTTYYWQVQDDSSGIYGPWAGGPRFVTFPAAPSLTSPSSDTTNESSYADNAMGVCNWRNFLYVKDFN